MQLPAICPDLTIQIDTEERFALRRFLDGENITQLEFEAELSCFLELMRKFRQILQENHPCKS